MARCSSQGLMSIFQKKRRKCEGEGELTHFPNRPMIIASQFNNFDGTQCLRIYSQL